MNMIILIEIGIEVVGLEGGDVMFRFKDVDKVGVVWDILKGCMYI